jgi:periplasmic mercuric ion binding protein
MKYALLKLAQIASTYPPPHRPNRLATSPVALRRRRRLVANRLAIIVLGLGVLASSSVVAAERTVTLAVQNMFCADCPFIVKKSLEAVPGVAKATVSYKDKTAVVTYDDGMVDIKSLTDATTNAGYPSAPKS